MSIFTYVVVFLVSVLSVYFGISQYKKKKRVIGIFLIVIGVLAPSILAGIRHNVGVDYPTYVRMYENVIAGKPMYFRSIEPASTLIITTAAHLRSSVFMFFAFSLITNICFLLAFMRLFKYERKKVALAFLIYLCIIFPTTLNAVRSGTAIAVATLAFSYLIQKWSPKTILFGGVLMLLAFLFHRSIVILLLFLPVFWLAQMNIRKRALVKKVVLFILYLLPAIFLPAIYYLVKDIIPLGDYGRYAKDLGSSFSMPLANIVMIIPIIYSLVYYYKNKNELDQDSAKIVYCSLFYIPLSVLMAWLTFTKGLSRITFVLDPIIICLMVCMLNSPQKTSKLWKTITVLCIVGVVGAMFVRNLNWSKAIPYKTIFQQEVTYAAEN